MRKTIKQLQGESDYWRVKFINEQKRAEAAEAKQDCNHEWFTLHYGHTEAIYGCKKCGQYKTGQGSY